MADALLKTWALMGGTKVAGPMPRSDVALHLRLDIGLPYRVFEEAAKHLPMTKEQLTESLALSRSTVLRRAKEHHLSREESASLVRLLRTVAYAEEVLGTREAALSWFNKPNRALGGVVPMGLMTTDVGAAAVHAILGRIDYGVIS